MTVRTPFLIALAVAAVLLIVFCTVELSHILAYVPTTTSIEGERI